MSRRALISFRSMLAFTFLAGFAWPAAAATDARLSESYGKLPLQFEANRGQTHRDVRFLSRGPGYSLYLTAGEAVLVLSKPDAKAQEKSVALRVSLVGAARRPAVAGTDELPGNANYFIGKDRSKWRTNVPTYAKVHYREVYPGIDLVYYGNQRQLEYDFVVAPGADPKKIVLGFKGAEKLEIDARGDLVLHAAGEDIRQHKPVIYQNIDGVRQEIAGGYVRKGANRVGIKVAAYDASRPLVIDPVVLLLYSTYLGGSGSDGGGAIAVDASGAAYVAGGTSSLDFPRAGADPGSLGGASDAFVAKLNPAGTALVYSAYLGGSGADNGAGIAVDAGGNVWLTGSTTSIDFPTTPGAAQPIFGGGTDRFGFPFSDAFVAKIDPTGSVLVYSTYLGGSRDEHGTGIAIDGDGNAYVTGATNSDNFPATPGAFQPAYSGALFTPGGRPEFPADAFVTKLNPASPLPLYSTYLGGSLGDGGSGIAVDADGNAYVAGSTNSRNFPTTTGAFQPAIGAGNNHGGNTVFVTKVNPAGSALVYSTYLGGSRDESGAGIVIDGDGSAYVTGYTTSSDFPTTAGAFQPNFGGGSDFTPDTFVTKLDPTGSALVYSTHIGGSSSGRAIAVDAAGSAHITGQTHAVDFPTTPGAFQSTHGSGSPDAFVTKFNPTGSALLYSSYLGGNFGDSGLAIALDASGNFYVTGITDSTDFPTTTGALQPAFGGGGNDAFIAKFGNDASLPAPGTTRSEESAATQIGFWTTYGAETGTFSGGSVAASNVAASTAIFSFTGTAVSWIGVKCNVCGVAAVSIDGGVPTTVDTAGPNAPGSLTSESVFSASGLAAANHTIAIVVTGMSNSGGSYVALDAFDVTAGSVTSPLLPPVALPPPPVTIPPLPVFLGL